MRVVTTPSSRGHLGGAHEPGADPGPGRDGLPDRLGAQLELELLGVLVCVRHGHSFSRSMRDVVLGWTATTSRKVRPAVGVLVVVLGDEGERGAAQLLGERGPVGGRGEPDLAVQRERGQRAVLACGTRDQRPDVLDQPAGQRQQPARRRAGRATAAARAAARQRGGGDHVRQGGRPHDALDHVALAPLLDQLDEPVLLEGAQVVVDLLAGQPEPVPEGGRGAGLGQLGEQPGAHGVERRLRGGRVLDDRDVEHVSPASGGRCSRRRRSGTPST